MSKSNRHTRNEAEHSKNPFSMKRSTILISQGTGRDGDYNIPQLKHVLKDHLKGEMRRKPEMFTKSARAGPEKAIDSFVNLEADTRLSITDREGGALISKEIAKRLYASTTGVAKQSLTQAFANGQEPRLSIALAFLEHGLDNNGNFGLPQLKELFLTMGLDVNPRMQEVLIPTTRKNWSKEGNTLAELMSGIKRQEEGMARSGIVPGASSNDWFRTRVRTIHEILQFPKTSAIQEQLADYVRLNRGSKGDDRIRESALALTDCGNRKTIYLPLLVRGWCGAGGKEYLGRNNDPDRYDDLTSDALQINTNNLEFIHDTYLWFHDKAHDRGNEPTQFLNQDGSFNDQALPFAGAAIRQYLEDKKHYPDQRPFLSESMVRVSNLLTPSKDSTEDSMLSALFTMSHDFLSSALDLLQASESGEEVRTPNSKPYKYCSELKAVLKGEYPYISQSVLQSLSPPEVEGQDLWYKVLPPMEWFHSVRVHLQAAPLEPKVARACEKNYRRNHAVPGENGDAPNHMMTEFLNQVADVTSSNPVTEKQKSKTVKGFNEWTSQFEKTPGKKAPKLNRRYANHLKSLFRGAGSTDKRTVEAITAAVLATRHKPDLKAKGSKKSEPPSACHNCNQTEKPWHWAKECPARDNRDLSKVTCYNCDKKGHYASACPSKTKPNGKRKVNALKDKTEAKRGKKEKKSKPKPQSDEEILSDEEEEESASGSENGSDE